jgi:hypothetical protein
LLTWLKRNPIAALFGLIAVGVIAIVLLAPKETIPVSGSGQGFDKAELGVGWGRASDSTALTVSAAPSVKTETRVVLRLPKRRASDRPRTIDATAHPDEGANDSETEDAGSVEITTTSEATAPIRAEVVHAVDTSSTIIPRGTPAVFDPARARSGVFVGGGAGVPFGGVRGVAGLWANPVWRICGEAGVTMDFEGSRVPVTRFGAFAGVAVDLIRLGNFHLLAGAGIDNHRQPLVALAVGG